MMHATLCFLVYGSNILLGMKKRGFGKGKYNGIGGKVEDGESADIAAKRELYEEIGVNAEEMEKVAELSFFFPHSPEWNQVVHVFLAKRWSGVPAESEEMKPEWFPLEKMPFEKMWSDDRHWLPLVLAGKKVKARFVFREDESIGDMELEELNSP